ncbi:trimeric intracellular cation channel family protein [Aestuariimicrobium soli]|uniref:trimeric intracellular cation channel family protein n=1 Tax=Aestuariimicrobium soli TaxID=2035834 RepID=UPI003EBF6678
MHWFEAVMQVVDLLGVLGNAILGGMAARAARLDFVGFAIVAVISGLGGGMIRDALLGGGPVVALTNPFYLGTALVGAVVAFGVNFSAKIPRRTLVLLDALAVGCWGAVGATKGLAHGLSWLAAILLGVVTVVGGGMVRDVMLMKRPVVLGGNTLYATSAFAAATVMVGAAELGHPQVGVALALAVGAGLSLGARRFGWRLPTEARTVQFPPVRFTRTRKSRGIR